MRTSGTHGPTAARRTAIHKCSNWAPSSGLPFGSTPSAQSTKLPSLRLDLCASARALASDEDDLIFALLARDTWETPEVGRAKRG